jgi:monoamine oxidase
MEGGGTVNEKRSRDSKSESRSWSALNRRTFIQSIVGGVAAAPLLGCDADGTASGDDYDVIVIGGGFAGAVAARETSLRGLKTLLLEAQQRLGGRTWTMPLGGHDLEVGGTWIGWSQPHVWAEISRYGLDVDESASASAERAVWMSEGQRVEGPYEDYAALFERAANAFYEPARAAFPRPFTPMYAEGFEDLDRMTAAQAIANLDLSETERGLALALASINGHSPPDQSSYLDQQRWIALGDFNVWNMFDNLARYRIRGGTKLLLERIHSDSRCETRLGQPVKSVVQHGGGVTATSHSGEVYHARSAIVAVPLNCLADVAFEPALNPAKLRVSRARHTGSGTKVYARIRGKKPLFVGHGTHDMPLSFLWTEYDDADSQILVGFGASQDLLDTRSMEAVSEAVRAYLPDAELIEHFSYNWTADPYARGTWCMYRPNVLTQDFVSLQRPEGKVFFAGADIANGWRGFIDGAIESGLVAGRQVAKHLATTA